MILEMICITMTMYYNFHLLNPKKKLSSSSSSSLVNQYKIKEKNARKERYMQT